MQCSGISWSKRERHAEWDKASYSCLLPRCSQSDRLFCGWPETHQDLITHLCLKPLPLISPASAQHSCCNVPLQNRSIQRTAFERVYFPNSGEAPALSSPLILQLKRDGRWERGADLITVARSFDRESRQVAGFAPLQAVCFNVFGCLIASAGASGRLNRSCNCALYSVLWAGSQSACI